MRLQGSSRRGQVLIIFVFVIIGLLGITGLAVDGGMVYTNRRQAQNAADAAALAAAVVKVKQQHGGATGCADLVTPTTCGALVKTTALNMAGSNGFTNNITDSTVEVHIPPLSPNPYSNCGSPSFNCMDYVQVIIHTNVNTYFAKVLGVGQTHNSVEAVALSKFKPEQYYFGGNSLVALNPHSTSCYGDVYFGGSGTVTLNGGGLFVNSDNATCAFKMTNTCPTVNLYGGAQLKGVGGAFNGCGAPPYYHPFAQMQYPPDPVFASETPFPPAECGITPAPSFLDGSGFTHFYPGHYAMLPPDKNTVLEPGVYCVDNVVKTTNPTTLKNDPLAAGIGGVFIYIKPGGSFNFQGGIVNLHAPKSGPYKGFLMYVDEADTGWWTPSAPDCTINGSSQTTFDGVIYAPHCDVTINGGSTPVGFTAQIVGFTISLEGSANLNFTFDPSKAPRSPEINWTGLFH